LRSEDLKDHSGHLPVGGGRSTYEPLFSDNITDFHVLPLPFIRIADPGLPFNLLGALFHLLIHLCRQEGAILAAFRPSLSLRKKTESFQHNVKLCSR